MSEDNTVEFPKTPPVVSDDGTHLEPGPEPALSDDGTRQEPEGAPVAEEQPQFVRDAEDAFGPENVKNLGLTFHIPNIEDALRDLFQRFNLVLGLVQALGEHKGMKLKQRQMPDGKVQFYWQAEGGRIVIPHGRN